MKAVNPDQVREIDRRCADEYGILTERLIEASGKCVFLETLNYLNKLNYLKNKSIEDLKVICVCGKGNNGEDGRAAGKYFSDKGAEALIISVQENPDIDFVKDKIDNCDVVIDAIFGTGLNSEVKGIYSDIIDIINSAKRSVKIAVDIPSGINGYTGSIMGNAVKADMTAVLALPKAGNLIYPGKEYCGRTVVCDIGIPDELLKSFKIKMFETEANFVGKFFTKRTFDTNKGTYGKVGIISGSRGMTGAGILASKAALRMGAGLVYNIAPEKLAAIYETAVIEAVTVPVSSENEFFRAESVRDVLEVCEKMDSIVIGPGLGRNHETEGFLFEFLNKINYIEDAYKKVLIIDADALNILSKDVYMLKNINMTCILTPHPGEMARLCNVKVKDVQADRINSVRYFSQQYEKITVLKGAATVTGYPDGTVYINPTGNPGMATAGSGDVLCGIIAAMGAFGNPETAPYCGVYLHGLAGDLASEKYGEYSMNAGDIVDFIPAAIKSCQSTGQGDNE